MAWSWSHSPEAYQNAQDNLDDQPLDWLRECLAEICASETDDFGASYSFDVATFDKRLAQIKADTCMAQDVLVDMIWRFAESQRTSDNGGFNAWCCPFGCHTVSFDKEELI